jgi:hypothetical protein
MSTQLIVDFHLWDAGCLDVFAKTVAKDCDSSKPVQAFVVSDE